MKCKIILILLCSLAVIVSPTYAQVKITDNNNLTINSNAILDLESDSLGFLPPRVAINNLNAASPLIAPVTAGMMVYSSGGSVADGYYCWDGSKWVRIFGNGPNVLSTVTKTASGTLTKSDNIVFASNDITLTLPAITIADNGLSISVKNVGTYMDLIKVAGGSSATIDGADTIELIPLKGQTFIANGSNWFILNRDPRTDDILDVGPNDSFETIAEVLAFLEEHMDEPMTVRLENEMNEISSTQVIDLPYPVTFQGLSFGETTIGAASGLTGKPMFRCISECYFKMLIFDGSTLANYGNNAGEDAIRFIGDGTYHEIKDSYFSNFNKAVVDSSNTEIWIFETDFEDIVHMGFEMTGAGTGAKFYISEVNFINCPLGIELRKGNDAVLAITNCGFYGSLSNDSAIVYRPATFDFATIAITANTWNGIGLFISGFDFSRTDGRDANAAIENNIGMENQNPHCGLSVINNSTSVTCTTANVWYLISWVNTSSYTCKWTIVNNKITYQPMNKRDVILLITGNIQVNSGNKTLTLGIVKNGSTSIRYGETTIRTPQASNEPTAFAMVVYVEKANINDYFELWVSNASGGNAVTVQDVNWFVNSQ